MANNKSKYRAVVEALKDDIRRGKWQTGRPLPSIPSIANRFNVAYLTATRALDELKKMGYVMAIQGKGTFVVDRRRTIGLIVPALSTAEIFSPICHEISMICQEREYMLYFADEQNDQPDRVGMALKRIAEKLIDERVSGVIFHPVDYCENASEINHELISMFKAADIPVVLLDCDLDSTLERSDLDQVGIDNIAAGWKIGKHLLERKAKKVFFVMRTKWSVNVRKRLIGLQNALSEVKGAKVEEFHLTETSRKDLMRRFRRKLPDAIVCSSDAVAAIVLKQLLGIGKRVPDDVLLTGVNDVEIARITAPSLTTIHQPCAAIARSAVDMLEWRIANPNAGAKRVSHGADLIVRHSTGK